VFREARPVTDEVLIRADCTQEFLADSRRYKISDPTAGRLVAISRACQESTASLNARRGSGEGRRQRGRSSPQRDRAFRYTTAEHIVINARLLIDTRVSKRRYLCARVPPHSLRSGLLCCDTLPESVPREITRSLFSPDIFPGISGSINLTCCGLPFAARSVSADAPLSCHRLSDAILADVLGSVTD